MKYDHRNTLVVAIAVTIGAIALMVMSAVVHDRAEDLRTERQITERVRVEACRTIADEDTRAFCVLGVKEAAR